MTTALLHGPASISKAHVGKSHDSRASNTRQVCLNMRLYKRLRAKRLIVLGFSTLLIWYLFDRRFFDRAWRNATVSRGDITTIKNQREGQLGLSREEPNPRGPKMPSPSNADAVSDEPTQPSKDKFASKHYYEGEISFNQLSLTMRSMTRPRGWQPDSNDILFCASSLKIAAYLIPLACDMAQQGLNGVHLAFMGRNTLSLRDIMLVNNVDQECEVTFHDARPDHALYSTDARAESSVVSAVTYMHQRIHPQAVITYSPELEDEFFTRATTKVSSEIGIPLIQIPHVTTSLSTRSLDNLAWITRLDAAALGAWDKPDIEIVIQVQTRSAGKVIKLLESLWHADYAGTVPPRLVVDLPSETDELLIQKLSRVQWPPGKTLRQRSELSIRRRISTKSITAEQASLRFIESFFPANADRSHVLVLSSNSLVSPLYYQALRYYLLQLKYSHAASLYPPLMGIALNLPKTFANGSGPFVAPALSAMNADIRIDVDAVSPNARPHFFWPAPNADAALYFGGAWKELQSFVSYRLVQFQSEPTAKPRMKVLGDHMPAWAEYASEYMQARGLSFFYVGSVTKEDAFVTTSSVGADKPDEHHDVSTSISTGNTSIILEPFLPTGQQADPLSRIPIRLEKSPKVDVARIFRQPLIKLLPFRNKEPSPYAIPQLSWDGQLSAIYAVAKRALFEAEQFRQNTGGCDKPGGTKTKQRKIVPGSARDLFCF